MRPRAATAAARRAACALLVATALPACRAEDVARLGRDAAPSVDLAAGAADRPAAPRPLSDWRLLGATAAVCAALGAARFLAARRPASLPPDVFEVLGTATLGGAHAVRIVRFGPKTLLVGVSAAGATTLAEIADPQATALIATACREGGRSGRPGLPPAGTAARAPRPAPRPQPAEAA